MNRALMMAAMTIGLLVAMCAGEARAQDNWCAPGPRAFGGGDFIYSYTKPGYSFNPMTGYDRGYAPQYGGYPRMGSYYAGYRPAYSGLENTSNWGDFGYPGFNYGDSTNYANAYPGAYGPFNTGFTVGFGTSRGSFYGY